MSEACSVPTTQQPISAARATRRHLLSGGTIALLTGIAGAAVAKPDQLATIGKIPTVAPLQPDAVLLALASQFMAFQARVDFIDKDKGVDHQDELDHAVDQQAALLDEMHDLKATTIAGHRARARVLLGWYTLGTDGDFEAQVSWDRVGPLFRDLIAEAV